MRLRNRPDPHCLHELTQLQARLQKWRRQSHRPTRLPQAFWRQAASLARRLGVSRVSRALRLSYPKLKHSTAQGSVAPQPAPPAFVEVAWADPSAPEHRPSYRAELSDGTGRHLVLHLGAEASTVLALAQSFWRRSS